MLHRVTGYYVGVEKVLFGVLPLFKISLTIDLSLDQRLPTRGCTHAPKLQVLIFASTRPVTDLVGIDTTRTTGVLHHEGGGCGAVASHRPRGHR
jgi:hypothetical protein